MIRPSIAAEAPSMSPNYTCSGKDIVSRFTDSDVRYSPQGPDRYMALHIAARISAAVTKAELIAVQRDLEMVMAHEGDNDGGPEI
jgi:hypothetical protein